TSTGSVTYNTKSLVVASAAGFTANSKIRIPGAGALQADGTTHGDLDTYIASLSGNTITLAGAAMGTVSGATVVQNATRNGALYRSKADLAVVAKGMHGGSGVVYPVTFS